MNYWTSSGQSRMNLMLAAAFVADCSTGSTFGIVLINWKRFRMLDCFSFKLSKKSRLTLFSFFLFFSLSLQEPPLFVCCLRRQSVSFISMHISNCLLRLQKVLIREYMHVFGVVVALFVWGDLIRKCTFECCVIKSVVFLALVHWSNRNFEQTAAAADDDDDGGGGGCNSMCGPIVILNNVYNLK